MKNKIDWFQKGMTLPPKSEIMTEIINLKAILNLPKGTEHFISDIHGEYDAFQHVLRNASGSIKEKIRYTFNHCLNQMEQNEFAFLVYYPEEIIKEQEEHKSPEELKQWYYQTIERLIELMLFVSRKYTRSKVRKALPKGFEYVTEELLYRQKNDEDKSDYYDELIHEIIRLGRANDMMIGLCYSIQRLVVDHLHIVGDIFDRGPAPDKIIDALIDHHSVDIQWGNHDITWIGAASGSDICIMNVLRISARYNNLEIIEDTYGINLRPLLTFAEKTYQDNPAFRPKVAKGAKLSPEESLQITQMHQAVAIMQFKLESQLIKRQPEFNMDHRLLLQQIDWDTQQIHLKGNTYPLEHTCFQTIDPANPDQLTKEEQSVINHLLKVFLKSEKLQRHIRFIMEKGEIYTLYNNNLLIHGCIPMTETGDFKSLTIKEKQLKGKALLDMFEKALRLSYTHPHTHNDLAKDLVWYLWTGESSSLFGKNEMTTFERYFIQDKTTHKEEKNPYFTLRNQEDVCRKILHEFGLKSQDGHIINGHTPVKEINGENPIKAGGKMIVIDGGFSKPYHSTTGIAGYTLVYNSYGMQLVAHQPFYTKKDAICKRTDIISTKRLVDRVLHRKKVKDTNTGKHLQAEIDFLESLLTHREDFDFLEHS